MKVVKLHRNADPKNQPAGTSRLIINYNINYEFGSNAVEDGFDFIPEYEDTLGANFTATADKTVIGHVLLPDNSICLFSNLSEPFILGYEKGWTEIGIFNNSMYKPVLRVKIGGDEVYPIEGTAKLNNLGEIIIYWTDFKNPQRWLNLTSPSKQLTIGSYLASTEVDKLLYFPATKNEKVELQTVTVGGGDLPSGVYIPVYKYADVNYNDTNAIFNSSVISIGDGIVQGVQYDGAPPNTISNKSITLRIDYPDTRYYYVHLYLVYKAESSYVVYDCGYSSISLSYVFNRTINTLTNLTTVPLEAILVTHPDYATAKSVTQLDSVMYWGNLKTRPYFDFQPYVNNIVIQPVQTPLEVANGNASDFRNEVTIYNDKGFLYNEVYAFYVSFSIEDEYGSYETEAYHIPGRGPAYAAEMAIGDPVTGGMKLTFQSNPASYVNVSETDLVTKFNAMTNLNGISVGAGILLDDYMWNGGGAGDFTPAGEMYKVNPNAKMYHAFPTGNNSNAASRMGFWQNENEFYSNTDNWDKKNAQGEVFGSSYKGQKVRHHRFPHASKEASTTNSLLHFNQHPTGIGFDINPITPNSYEQINNLGAKLTSIVIPIEFEGKIKKINTYYAKRTNSNKTILGQSIALHDAMMLNAAGGSINSGDSASNTFETHIGGNVEILNLPADGAGITENFRKQKKFIRSSPFDIVSTDSYSDVSYINVLYKINSIYAYETLTGDAYPSVVDPAKSASVGISCRLETKTNFNLTIPGFNIFNRQVIKSNYLSGTPPYPTTQYDTVAKKEVPMVLGNQSIYGYSKNLYHYRADKAILMELQNELDNSPSTAVPGRYTSDVVASITGSTDTLNFDMYLVNLCAFKTDLYTNFTAQELVFAGSSEIVSGESSDIYQGDTFSNWYGYFSDTDISGIANLGLGNNRKWDVFEWKFLHHFICQSVSNINFRNRGTSTYNTYYPFTDVVTILKNPLTPNGEPNYYDYNSAYSSVDDLHQPAIASMFLIGRTDSFPTRVIRTAKDSIEATYDNYRVVLTNDYLDLPKDKGPIWSIKGVYNKLSILFTNTVRETLGRERLLTENAESYVGAGDIFAVPPKDIQTVDGGYGGTVSQWAINTTPYGMFYVDINRGKVFMSSPSKTGTTLDEISKEDMFYFFRDECKFTFYPSIKQAMEDVTPLFVYGGTYPSGKIVRFANSYFQSKNLGAVDIAPGNPAYWTELFDSENIPVDGLDSIFCGFRSSYDPVYKRIILSKTDLTVTAALVSNFAGYTNLVNYNISPYTQNFINNKIYLRNGEFQLYTNATYPIVAGDTWTVLSLNNTTYFTKSQWTISYYPEAQAWGSFYTFYPETIFNSNDSLYSTKGYKLYEHNKTVLPIFYQEQSFELATMEASFADAPDMEKLYKSVQFKTKAIKSSNNTNSTEYLTTFDNYRAYNSYQASKKLALTNLVSARNLEGYWSVNNFRDYFTHGLNMFLNSWDLPFSSTNFGITKWQELKRFVGNWFAIRFEYNNTKTETIEFNNATPPTIIQENTAIGYGLGDYNIKLTIALPITPLYVNDWVIVFYEGNITSSLGQIYRIVGNVYYVKFRKKIVAVTALTVLTITRTKNIKLSLLEISATYIKNTR